MVSEEESPPGSLLVEIDGKEEEIPLPELIKGYQLARDAHKHIKEAIQAKEDSKVVVDGLIQDHWGTYHRALTAAFGGDTDQALNYLVQEAKALVAEYSKFEKLPREQQEVITLKRKLAEREQALADREHQIAYERESASETQAKAQALAEITTAMKQNGIRVDVRSASTRFFIQDVARKLMDAPSMETSDAVKEVLKDVSKQLEERLKIADQVDPEVIQGLLPNLAENFRKKDLNGVKQARGARVTPKEPALKHEAAKKQVVLKDGDWDTYFRSR